MAGGDHLAESPHWNVAEIFGRRKQLPVIQLIAENGVSDVVGCQCEAIDFDQQRVIGQGGGVRQLRSVISAGLGSWISSSTEVGTMPSLFIPANRYVPTRPASGSRPVFTGHRSTPRFVGASGAGAVREVRREQWRERSWKGL